MRATDSAAATAKASGMVTIETKAHIFRKGESNGFCEWFGCEFISVMGLIKGRNLIELHYVGKETVFVAIEATECENSVAFWVNDCGELPTETVLQLYKVMRYVFDNVNGILSTRLID